uniref:BTB domain-containing protein n=1 Tax=Leersia perrieri TaxID=77586 RepID=A0A0D9X5K1_9ORYZ
MSPACSKTISTSTPATARGSHVFTITGYSKHRSGIFSVGGHNWSIRFYPDGESDDIHDYISVFLELMTKNAVAHLSCDIRLVDQITGVPSPSVNRTAPRLFKQNHGSSLVPRNGCFMRRSYFEASDYLCGDQLSIESIVTVIKGSDVSRTRSCDNNYKICVPRRSDDVAASFGRLLEPKETCDVRFSVGGETFDAHRAILAIRSPVFMAELFGPMRKKGTKSIVVKDMQPDVFRAMLRFIYTDSLDTVDVLQGDDYSAMIRHLLVAADRYDMERLKLECQSILCEHLVVHNVATTLGLAEQHNCSILMDACIRFMGSSAMDDIVATKGFVDLKDNCPTVLVDALVEVVKVTPVAATTADSIPPPSVHPSSGAMKRHQIDTAPRTFSTCIPNKAEGTHIFDIVGYSQIKGRGHKEHVTSGTFDVGGFHWAIVLYPDPHLVLINDDDDNVKAFLELKSQGGGKVRAACDVRLVDQSTGLSSSAQPNAKEFKVFDSDDSESKRGSCLSIKREKFETAPYLVDDRITMECVVTVKKEPRVSRARPVPRIKVPPSNIMTQLGDLLESKEGADVVFDVAGVPFPAHKLMLAMRSPVFKAELCGPMREEGTEPITIVDMQPDVFRALLQFIYTDWLPSIREFEGDDNGEMIRHLLVAADRYAVDRLKLLCQSILCKNLSVQNVATTLALADQHHCGMLKDACIEFMSCPNMVNDVVASQGFVDLEKTAPSLVAEAKEKMGRFKKMSRMMESDAPQDECN